VLRCGGGRALTKHDEIAAKAQLGLDEANKIVALASTTELVCNEALVIGGEGVKPVNAIVPVKVKAAAVVQSKVSKAVDKLYDLERSGAAEKKLNVDLDLYQIENY
jgi:hypothetical protein